MRLEYKFLVSNNDLPKLRMKMMPYLSVDPFAKDKEGNQYTVRSIYYDTSSFDYYHEKMDGIKIRKKLRIRSYNKTNASNIVFLEIKNKYDNFIGKNRSPLEYEDLVNLLETKQLQPYIMTNNGYANSIEDAEKFLHHFYKNDLKPTVLIVYDREAYFSKFDPSLRITFDKNIRYLENPSLDLLYEDGNLEYAIPNHFVLEIKFANGYPKWLQNIVMEFNLTRRSVSKYTICIDSSKIINPFKRTFTSTFNDEDIALQEGVF
ncbi:MAG: polyphosphate polymerase domain-containing protein [Melioribacteraceae bacterium]